MKIITSLLALGCAFISHAQLNTTQLGHLDINSVHSTGLNDIWGYVDTAGNEYAIVGATDGVSIVDVTNPAVPIEVSWTPGLNSIWRDIKTFNKHAYVTTEANEGLLIIDMSTLPNAAGIDTLHWFGPGLSGDSLKSAHNLFIDSAGYCYIFGSNIANGGVRILDLNVDPKNPVEVGFFENWYVHDGMVLADTLYLGHISDGFLSVVNVSNKTAPVFEGSINTPSNFTHNVWVSDDGQHAFTTDEVGGGYIGSYNVSDPMNIVEDDKIQSSPGAGTIPHNTHFMNDYLITSYYADGITIHDVSDPTNMIEVGNFDSSPASGNTFDGCWGTYPYLPSGNIILSDRQLGLFILAPNYVRGCYLTGQVTDQVTSGTIPNAQVYFLTENIADNTNLSGNYQTGHGVPGNYDVVYYKPGYFPDTVQNISLSSGNTTIQDVQLVPKVPFTMVVRLLDNTTLLPIENGKVHIFNNDFDYNVTTNANGYVSINGFYEDFYDLVGGNWGNVTKCLSNDYYDSNNDTVVLTLSTGYYDDFSLDLNWVVAGNAQTGMFERGVPIGTGNSNQANPGIDAQFDCYNFCYMSGNGGQGSDHDDVDYGYTTVTSPSMDLSTYTDPYVNYSAWFYNKFGPYPEDDTAFIYLINTNTLDSFMIDTMTNMTVMSAWVDQSMRVLDFTPTTDSLKIAMYVSDLDTMINITEAAFDRFRVTEGYALNTPSITKKKFRVYPNPSTDVFNIELLDGAYYQVIDMSGRVVVAWSKDAQFDLSDQANGIYLVKVSQADQVQVLRIIKI